VESGNILEAESFYRLQCIAQPLNWWPFYRTAWCSNNLDRPDSALVYAETALRLQPSSENCLSELMKSLSSEPARVLQYSNLVSGGGSCRYRLARAEIDLSLSEKPSLDWLQNSFSSGVDSVSADAGCWLSILHGDSGLVYIQQSVLLMPEEEFYQCLFIEKLISNAMLDMAAIQFELLKETSSGGLSFWQTASSLYDALGDQGGAIEASRRAFELRQIPSTAADLGWKLYFYGRSIMREGSLIEAMPYLRESRELWNSDSLWAVKSDSLLDLINQFTGTAEGFGEPI
jgi:tetratricopeptide (TPR) repeat protein